MSQSDYSSTAELIKSARSAVTILRDSARTGYSIGFMQRDRLVVVLHDALDRLETLW